jgi:hypothetical protein
MAAVSRVLGPMALSVVSAAAARADTGQCHVIDVDFMPTANLQIVAWVEDTTGHYIDTIFITQATGTYGIGNRPGRFDFNSGSPMFPSWPYGRRVTTFPVWAHRHGMTFPEVEFQNNSDNDLSHPFDQSSRETHFCRPLQPAEAGWDSATCASAVFTDKGVMSTSKMSLYPPRQDITRQVGTDSVSVDMYGALNPFDAVSQATPPGGVPAQITWPIPQTLPAGNYVMFVEVSREFDMNTTYNETSYPSPTGIAYAEYGQAYRGQPSVVYKVPFTVNATTTTADTLDYIGYGDPGDMITGATTGAINPPDATITTAAQRLQIVSYVNDLKQVNAVADGTNTANVTLLPNMNLDHTTYRVRVIARNENDSIPPAAPANPQVQSTDVQSATLTFIAPGDDGTVGRVSGYEIRYRASDTITDANFGSSILAASPPPVDPGAVQTVTIDKLLPETDYSVGVRAYDKCHNLGPLVVMSFRTGDRQAGTVDACFVATAAYGSLLATDVGMLRHFRDSMLKSSVLGELAVETYYTFGPAMAGVIGESDLLRATARTILAPIVAWVRTLAF